MIGFICTAVEFDLFTVRANVTIIVFGERVVEEQTPPGNTVVLSSNQSELVGFFQLEETQGQGRAHVHMIVGNFSV
jgi:hypothetical protein